MHESPISKYMTPLRKNIISTTRMVEASDNGVDFGKFPKSRCWYILMRHSLLPSYKSTTSIPLYRQSKSLYHWTEIETGTRCSRDWKRKKSPTSSLGLTSPKDCNLPHLRTSHCSLNALPERCPRPLLWCKAECHPTVHQRLSGWHHRFPSDRRILILAVGGKPTEEFRPTSDGAHRAHCGCG